jgi:hypothetical protein
MAVVDGRVSRHGVLVMGKPTGSEAGAEGVMLGAGEVQKGIIGVKESDTIGHGDLLSKDMRMTECM